MAGYVALADVYEWLIPDDKLTPEGSVAALGNLVQELPSHARVLDCSCGTGQLAVGLAHLGLNVVATDASAGMIRRTEQLAEDRSVSLEVRRVAWEDLSDCFDPSTFDLVVCVGNSLGHAQGAAGRLTALAEMSRLLRPQGRLLVASRTWERVRAAGSQIEVRDRLVRRGDHEAVVIYSWQIEALWEQEHHLEIAVARVNLDGSVQTNSEKLSFWPYRYEELVADLQSVGLRLVESTFDPSADGYMVVTSKA